MANDLQTEFTRLDLNGSTTQSRSLIGGNSDALEALRELLSTPFSLSFYLTIVAVVISVAEIVRTTSIAVRREMAEWTSVVWTTWLRKNSDDKSN